MQTDPHDRRPHRWMKWALAGSLALNLVVIGLVGGAFVRHDRHGSKDGGAAAYAWPYVAALPRETRREMFGQMRSNRHDGLPDRTARRAMYDNVLSALRADPFDPVLLGQLTRQQAATGVRLRDAAQDAWSEIVKGMSAQERLQYADDIEEALQRRKKRK